MKMFNSDNNSGVHPDIMDAIVAANVEHDNPYGTDEMTKKAEDMISEILGKQVDSYFVATGTAANIIGLSALLEPYEAVVCPDTGHINVEECGALQRFNGSRILAVPNRDGKISKEDIEGLLTNKGDEHLSQPRIISISQTTETGTVYSVEEIRELVEFAHENDMLVHVDGARIANAIVAEDSSFKEMITDTGVDLLSFGGTKNGMMMGEAIVSLNKEASRHFKYHRKQGMQLISKMRFVSAQFIAYLSDDLWRKNAQKANETGQYLKNRLGELEGVRLKEAITTNTIFVHMEDELVDHIAKSYDFHMVDKETGLLRLVTSYDMTKKDVDEFIEFLKDR